MVHKNNKRNRRRAAFYGISKFNYESKEKLAKGQPSPQEICTNKKKVEKSPGNSWTEVWDAKITIVKTNSRKA